MLNDFVARTLLAIFIFGLLFGGLIAWGLPKLWMLVRPMIHQMTA